MIYQLLVPTNVKTITPIPFTSGLYDLKIIRIEAAMVFTTQRFSFWLKSDRIPFKNTTYIENYPSLDRQGVNRCGLFLTARETGFVSITIPSIQTVVMDNTEAPLLFKDVFLDGFIDTQFFNSGLNSASSGSLTTPPYSLDGDGVRCLILMDITPK